MTHWSIQAVNTYVLRHLRAEKEIYHLSPLLPYLYLEKEHRLVLAGTRNCRLWLAVDGLLGLCVPPEVGFERESHI